MVTLAKCNAFVGSFSVLKQMRHQYFLLHFSCFYFCLFLFLECYYSQVSVVHCSLACSDEATLLVGEDVFFCSLEAETAVWWSREVLSVEVDCGDGWVSLRRCRRCCISRIYSFDLPREGELCTAVSRPYLRLFRAALYLLKALSLER